MIVEKLETSLKPLRNRYITNIVIIEKQLKESTTFVLK